MEVTKTEFEQIWTMNGTVEVSKVALDYLLAHYADEVDGTPDRVHWQLPGVRAAAEQLAKESAAARI